MQLSSVVLLQLAVRLQLRSLLVAAICHRKLLTAVSLVESLCICKIAMLHKLRPLSWQTKTNLAFEMICYE